MTATYRPVQLVLDTSAIVAFAAGSIAVGELIAEIDDEEGSTGLPALCLAEANQCAVDADRLNLLVSHHATVLLDLHAADWRALSMSAHEILGRADAATAVLAAVEFDCDVVTTTPRLYAGLDGDMILPIED